VTARRGSFSASLIMGTDTKVTTRDHTGGRDPFVVFDVPIDRFSGVRIHVRREHLATWQAAIDEARRMLGSSMDKAA
jgi:hypothetical protein